MITVCTSDVSFGDVFFFRGCDVFWLPTMGHQDWANYILHKHKEKVPSDKWHPISSKHLTNWSDEE